MIIGREGKAGKVWQGPIFFFFLLRSLFSFVRWGTDTCMVRDMVIYKLRTRVRGFA